MDESLYVRQYNTRLYVASDHKYIKPMYLILYQYEETNIVSLFYVKLSSSLIPYGYMFAEILVYQ